MKVTALQCSENPYSIRHSKDMGALQLKTTGIQWKKTVCLQRINNNNNNRDLNIKKISPSELVIICKENG